MVSPETTKPFQFGLRSIFLATSAIAVTLGLLHWLSPFGFFLFVIVAVQCSAVIAVLLKSDGTALRGVLIAGPSAAVLIMYLSEFNLSFFGVIVAASVGAWFGGGLAAYAESKRQSRFLRWAWLLALIWFVIVDAIIILAELAAKSSA